MTITQLWIYHHHSVVLFKIYTNPNLDWLAQLLPYDHNSTVDISPSFSCYHMTTTQLCTYGHALIVSISKRFTSSHQIRVGLSLVFYSYGNHGIKIDG
nr:MAG TPA: hypothetical protein [Caudoviricetes sp.]